MEKIKTSIMIFFIFLTLAKRCLGMTDYMINDTFESCLLFKM